MIRVKKLDQKGDTIVEVLITAVIVGTIMVGAFIAAGFSINEQTKAENRNTAIELAGSQIEELRSCSNGTSTGACTDSANPTQVLPYGNSCFYMTSDSSYTSSAATHCAGVTEDALYSVYIVGQGNPVTNNSIEDTNYTVYVTWNGNQTID